MRVASRRAHPPTNHERSRVKWQHVCRKIHYHLLSLCMNKSQSKSMPAINQEERVREKRGEWATSFVCLVLLGWRNDGMTDHLSRCYRTGTHSPTASSHKGCGGEGGRHYRHQDGSSAVYVCRCSTRPARHCARTERQSQEYPVASTCTVCKPSMRPRLPMAPTKIPR
jgi:hypothetical protein